MVEPGDRVVVDEHAGSVRWVGAVEGKEGTYVGVEWDDDARGRHDGVVAGTRYFECLRPGPRASLVRANLVVPCLSVS